MVRFVAPIVAVRQRSRARGGSSCIVTDDLLDGDAVAGEELDCAQEEAGAAGAFLVVVEDLGLGQSGVIIDGGQNVVIARPSLVTATLAAAQVKVRRAFKRA